jgi:hypothetical protein
MAAVPTRTIGAMMVALCIAGSALLAVEPAHAACCLCFNCANPSVENICASGVAFDAGAFVESVCRPLGCENAQCASQDGCEQFADCQPLGACCGAGDGCTEISEPGCRPLGGSYRGDATSCEVACARPVPAVSFPGTLAIAAALLAFGAIVLRRVGAPRHRG